jgi:hypothetical protein
MTRKVLALIVWRERTTRPCVGDGAVNMRSHFAAPERRGGTDMNRSRSAKALKGVSAGLAAWIVLAAVPVFAQKLPFCVTNPQLCEPNPTTVTNTNDSGPGSLRAAIDAAVSGDTINFNLLLPATIVLSTPLTPGVNMTISGPGRFDLAISGDGTVGPIFKVNGGITVTISGVTISGGNADPGLGIEFANGAYGGGISNLGTLTLDSVSVSGNRSHPYGGGVYNGGTLTLTNSTVSSNRAYMRPGDQANDRGGGIYNYSDPWSRCPAGTPLPASCPQPGLLTLINTTVSDNQVIVVRPDGPDELSGFGGGIYNDQGTVTLTNSTVSGNSGTRGGGIYNGAYGSALWVTNSTLAGNNAVGVGGVAGGGIYMHEENHTTGTITVSNSTIAGNSARCSIYCGETQPIGGGGVYVAYTDDERTSQYLTVKNTILANNDSYPDRGNCGGLTLLTQSLGHNLSDDDSCHYWFIPAHGDLNNTPAGLDPGGLKNNGGPTQTIALLAGSSAVDAIPLSDCTDASGNPVTTDQRGMSRPQGAGCDIGAFEYWQKPIHPFDPGGSLLR